MPKNYKSKNAGIPYFLTFTVVAWLNVFTRPAYTKILWDSLQFCRREKGLELYGFVFMTNHIHLLAAATQEKPLLWEIIRDFKKFTAQKIIQQIKTDDNRDWLLTIMQQHGSSNPSNTQYQFWIQDDGAIEIRSDAFLKQKLEYIHNNPVRAGIVERAPDYYWSSARMFEQDVFLEIDRLDQSNKHHK
ncbi:MAG: transposase [bacterium]